MLHWRCQAVSMGNPLLSHFSPFFILEFCFSVFLKASLVLLLISSIYLVSADWGNAAAS